MKNLYIIGAGGFAKDTLLVARRINARAPEWSVKGFLDDDPSKKGQRVCGYPVLGGTDALAGAEEPWVVCAVSAGKVRRSITQRLERFPHIRYATLIDPLAAFDPEFVRVGEGVVICPFTSVTADITIGNHVLINPACTIGHDAVLHDFSTLYPTVNVSGYVTIGACAEIGTGAQIIQGKSIGAETIIGAGAVVIRDIPGGCTAVGCPARVIG